MMVEWWIGVLMVVMVASDHSCVEVGTGWWGRLGVGYTSVLVLKKSTERNSCIFLLRVLDVPSKCERR